MSALACLALAVYFEARSEPLAGQFAVAQIVVQRVESDRYPDTICAVVTQGPTHSNGFPVRDACQFSFWCDGASERPRDHQAWMTARYVAAATLAGRRDSRLDGALHYHTIDSDPFWSQPHGVVIGNHVFITGVR